MSSPTPETSPAASRSTDAPRSTAGPARSAAVAGAVGTATAVGPGGVGTVSGSVGSVGSVGPAGTATPATGLPSLALPQVDPPVTPLPPTTYPGYTEHGYIPGYGPPRSNGLGTSALVLGIIGLVFSFIPLIGVIAWPLVILAIVFGALGMKKAGKGLASNRGSAVAGLVLGIIGLAVCVLWVVALFVNN